MKFMKALALILIIIGALNWGLVAVANFDLVACVAGLTFGNTNLFSRFVYGLVALAGVFEAVVIVSQLRNCEKS